MNLDEIKEIIAAIREQDITEFELQRGDEKIRIKRGLSSDNHTSPTHIVVTAAPVSAGSASPNAAPAPETKGISPADPSPATQAAEVEEELSMVTAPIVGTFYEAPSPGSPPLVEVGDRVEPGQVLCIIEAMKLMNEIEAEIGGVIVKRFVQNAQPVEYGEALFAIKAAD